MVYRPSRGRVFCGRWRGGADDRLTCAGPAPAGRLPAPARYIKINPRQILPPGPPVTATVHRSGPPGDQCPRALHAIVGNMLIALAILHCLPLRPPPRRTATPELIHYTWSMSGAGGAGKQQALQQTK